jgi:glucose/arabinose dehydrogenase
MTAELVVGDLNFPTGLAFDETGRVYIAESGLPFGEAPSRARIVAVDPAGRAELVAEGFRAPITGLSHHNGLLYVSEGGHPGRISRVSKDGISSVVLDGLPGPGNYHTNMAIVGPDGWLYFSQGAMTNSGVVGLDSYELGWLKRLPHAHDVPGMDIVLLGANFRTADPGSSSGARAVTGAFSPFGTPSRAGQEVKAQLPCTAAVMRCRLNGSHLELVAWGLRNAYGIGFLDDGRLLAIDQGADDRGSRPIGNAPDVLFEVVKDAWYGWPDYIGGVEITSSRFRAETGAQAKFLIANHSALPLPRAGLFSFAPHAAATKFISNGGQLYVALFGDERPMTAPAGPRAGRSIVRLDMNDWSLHQIIGDPLQRPIDVGLGPRDSSLYALDFGHFEMASGGRLMAKPGSGGLWRIS